MGKSIETEKIRGCWKLGIGNKVWLFNKQGESSWCDEKVLELHCMMVAQHSELGNWKKKPLNCVLKWMNRVIFFFLLYELSYAMWIPQWKQQHQNHMSHMLAQCPAYGRCSMNIFWILWDIPASKSTQTSKPSLDLHCLIQDNIHFPFICLFQGYLLLSF